MLKRELAKTTHLTYEIPHSLHQRQLNVNDTFKID